jgi:hypothetical protein
MPKLLEVFSNLKSSSLTFPPKPCYQKIEDFAGNAMKSVGDQVRPEKRFKHPDEYGAEFMPMVDSGICKPKECIRCEEYCLHEVYKVNAQEAKLT